MQGLGLRRHSEKFYGIIGIFSEGIISYVFFKQCQYFLPKCVAAQKKQV
jgi:hypothetical protein